jgi:hypothetical protein
MPRMSHEAALGSAEPPRRPAPRIGVINARGCRPSLESPAASALPGSWAERVPCGLVVGPKAALDTIPAPDAG